MYSTNGSFAFYNLRSVISNELHYTHSSKKGCNFAAFKRNAREGGGGCREKKKSKIYVMLGGKSHPLSICVIRLFPRSYVDAMEIGEWQIFKVCWAM